MCSLGGHKVEDRICYHSQGLSYLLLLWNLLTVSPPCDRENPGQPFENTWLGDGHVSPRVGQICGPVLTIKGRTAKGAAESTCFWELCFLPSWLALKTCGRAELLCRSHPHQWGNWMLSNVSLLPENKPKSYEVLHFLLGYGCYFSARTLASCGPTNVYVFSFLVISSTRFNDTSFLSPNRNQFSWEACWSRCVSESQVSDILQDQSSVGSGQLTGHSGWMTAKIHNLMKANINIRGSTPVYKGFRTCFSKSTVFSDPVRTCQWFGSEWSGGWYWSQVWPDWLHSQSEDEDEDVTVWINILS